MSKSLSVLVITYNRPEYLNLSLKAISESFEKPAEVLVVNNGGNKDDKAIVDKYGFDYERQEENTGPLKILSSYPQKLKGDLVNFTADDDMVMPHFFQDAVAYMSLTQDPKVAAIDFGLQRMDKDGKDLGYWGFTPIDESQSLLLQLIQRNLYFFPSFVCRRDVLKELGGFEGDVFGDVLDYAFYCKLIFNGYKIVRQNYPAIYYRIWSGQETERLLKEQKLRNMDMKVKDYYYQLLQKGK